MSVVEQHPSDQTAASLVSGIVGDLQQLVEQQLQLTRHEIEEELHQRAGAATILFVGVALLFLDAMVVCQSLALLLHWATSPTGTDPAWFPLWMCYATVAGVLVGMGGIVTQIGRSRFKSTVKAKNPATEILSKPVEKGG